MTMLDNRLITGEKLSTVKLILTLALSFLALLALKVRYEIGAGLETGNFIVDNLSKLSNQFYHSGISDMLCFAAIFLMMRFVAAREKRPDVLSLVLAAVFAGFYMISRVCEDMGNFSFFLANLYQLCLGLLVFVGLTALFYPLLRLLFYLMENPREGEENPLKHPWRSAALIIFICWLPWLFANYPCSFCPDAAWQIAQWLGDSSWSAHHPPVSSMLMGLCVSLGDLILDKNFGAFLYILFQSISGACIFGYMLSMLYGMGLSRRMWTVFVLFFATPFWAMFAQWFEKDFLYAQAFALSISFILPVVCKRSCSMGDALRIASVCVLTILLRKTGMYELLPALLLIGLWLKKADRLRLCSAALAVLLICSAVNNALYPALGISPGSTKEMLSLPFQQTARYVNKFPDEVTEQERAAIDAVLDYDKLGNYVPTVSDRVKATYREDASALPEYFKVWFEMLFKHPVCYFEAAFMLSYGYFAPIVPSLDAYFLSDYYPHLDELGFYRVFDDFPTRAFDSVREMFIQFPLTSILCTAGLYTWMMMLCFVQLLRKQQYSALLLFIPGIMNILVCIASPLYASTRYELPVIATVPLILAFTLMKSKNQPQ